MKRYFLIPLLVLMLLSVLMLPGCKQPDPSTTGSVPQVATPTTTPPDPTEPDPFVTVYLLSGYTVQSTVETKETAFVYDDAGRILEVLVGGEIVVAYTYGEQGNILAHKDTLQGIDRTYDAQGNILTDRTAEGCVTNTYDEQGHLISETFEHAGVVDHQVLHTYSESGLHLTATYCRDGVISDEGPSYEWKYDDSGYLKYEYIYYGEVFYQGTSFNYEPRTCVFIPSMRWDRDGNFWSFSTFYDKDGNISCYIETCKDSQGKVTHSLRRDYKYDTYGNTTMLVKKLNGETKTYHWKYDETGKHMLSCSLVSDSESYEYTVTYGANGNKLQQIRTGDTPHEILWEYDSRGRVVSVVRTGTDPQQTACVYDEFGNLIQKTITTNGITTVTTYSYTALRRLPEVAAPMQREQAKIFRHLHTELLGIA